MVINPCVMLPVVNSLKERCPKVDRAQLLGLPRVAPDGVMLGGASSSLQSRNSCTCTQLIVLPAASLLSAFGSWSVFTDTWSASLELLLSIID